MFFLIYKIIPNQKNSLSIGLLGCLFYQPPLGDHETTFWMVRPELRKIFFGLWLSEHVGHFCLMGLLFLGHPSRGRGSCFSIRKSEGIESMVETKQRKTKIVCTIGPASESSQIIEAMIRAGMNVARLNFSHGTQEEHLRKIKTIRQIADRLKEPVAILQDLSGPKIRVGKVKEGGVELRRGEDFFLTNREIMGDEKRSLCHLSLSSG